MSARNAWSSRLFVLLVLASLFLAGCQSAQTTIKDGEKKISPQIQSTLNDYITALKNNDKTLFMSTIDQDNRTIKNAFFANFDYLQRSGLPQTVELGITVNQIAQKEEDLVLAYMTRDRDGWQAAWYFRKKEEGNWVISEPTFQEAGEPRSTTEGNFTFTTYPIADEVNEKIIALMPKAEEHVRKDLGMAPDAKVNITIYPFTRLSPLGADWLSTFDIEAGENGANHIYIISPQCYSFGFYDPQTGWETDYETMLAREYSRVAYVHNFNNPGRGADWFFEGFVEYVAGFDQMPDVIAAVESDKIIPIVDESSSGTKKDLAHFSNTNDWLLAYEFSESLVAYILEKFGGWDTFWALARSLDETNDIKTSIQNTLNVSYEDFDAGWRKWLKEDYIKR